MSWLSSCSLSFSFFTFVHKVMVWVECCQLHQKLWFVMVVNLPPEHPNCLQVGKAGIFVEKLHINQFFSYIWWAYILLFGFWSDFDIVQGTILHFLQKLETNQNGNWKKSRQIITIRLCQKFIQMFAMTRIFKGSQALNWVFFKNVFL